MHDTVIISYTQKKNTFKKNLTEKYDRLNQCYVPEKNSSTEVKLNA